MKRVKYKLFLIFSVLLNFIIFASEKVYNSNQRKPIFRSNLIFVNKKEYPYSHASTIVELPSGDLMCAWYSGTAEKAKDVAIYSSVFLKEKNVWTSPTLLNDEKGFSEGNPVLFYSRDGKLFLIYAILFGESWDDSKIFMKYSEDNGKNWGDAKVIYNRRGMLTKNKPIYLNNGDILLPIEDEVLGQALFLISKDDGLTWHVAGDRVKPALASQPAVVECKENKLLALMRTGEKNSFIKKSYSVDNGKRWENALLTTLKNPDSGIDAVKLQDGKILIVFNDSFTRRNPLNIALSDDCGKNWYNKRVIDSDIGDLSYPAVIQASDGMIHITYSYNGAGIKHVYFNEEWLSSESD